MWILTNHSTAFTYLSSWANLSPARTHTPKVWSNMTLFRSPTTFHVLYQDRTCQIRGIHYVWPNLYSNNLSRRSPRLFAFLHLRGQALSDWLSSDHDESGIDVDSARPWLLLPVWSRVSEEDSHIIAFFSFDISNFNSLSVMRIANDTSSLPH